MLAQGTFDITMQPEPPYDTVDGVSLARIHVDKRFTGELEATSVVEMLAAQTPVAGSAGYVALERVSGTLAGRRGRFVLLHHAVMTRGTPSLSVTVVPDSASGELAGLAGTLEILVASDGRHHYRFDYQLDG
jgi:hypothetical protein